MATTRVGFTTTNADNASTATINLPAGTSNDDTVLLWVTSDGAGQAQPPAGFSTIYSASSNSTSNTQSLFVKVADNEPASYSVNVANGANERAYIACVVYREVDLITPIESNAALVNPTADQTMVVPNVTATGADQAIVAFMGVESGNSGNPLGSTWPSNYVLVDDNTNGPAGTGSGSSAGGFAEQFSTGAGTVTGGNLTYGGGNSHGAVVVVVLAAGIPPVIAVQTRDLQIVYGGTYTITGFGFGALQGTGKVELWSDAAGTIKTIQPITSWSDTSITYSSTQGSLSNNTTVFLVVTNDNGDETRAYNTVVGLRPYKTIISDLSPDHHWTLDNTYNDDGAFGGSPLSSVAAGDGGALVTVPISEDTTHSWRPTNDRREAPNSSRMNTSIIQDRCMGGWIRPETIYSGLTCIYEEGGGVNNVTFLIGIGNRIVASYADTGDDNAQAFSDFALEAGRAYHIVWRFSHTETVKEFRLFIDGVKQAVTTGNPLTSGDLDAHSGDLSWGGAGGNLEVAGTDVLFRNVTDMLYSNWFSFSTVVPESDILTLFRRGAIPTDTLTGTQAQIQSALNVLTQSRPNAPISIRIEQPSDVTDVNLDADGIVFPETATIWVEWRGGNTLNWTNLNGSNLRADKVYSTSGGGVNVINPATLTLTGLQNPTEVRVYEAGTTNEIAGQEDVVTGTFAATVQVPSVDIAIAALEYEIIRLLNINTSSNITLPIQQRFDRNYENP